jgi:hypothetical protein
MKKKSSKLKKSSKRSSKKISKISKNKRSKRTGSTKSENDLIFEKIKKLKSFAVIYADFKNPRRNPEDYDATSSIKLSDSFAAWRDANEPNVEYISQLQRMNDDELDRHFARKNPRINSRINSHTILRTNLRTNPKLRRNPGGGWIFQGRFANKWDGIRGRNIIDDILSKNGEFYAQLRDKKDGSWHVALVSKSDDTITIINVFNEIFDQLGFKGIGATEWEDIRIGYKSRGFELLNKKDSRWYAVKVLGAKNNVFTVGEVKYPLSGPMYPVGF